MSSHSRDKSNTHSRSRSRSRSRDRNQRQNQNVFHNRYHSNSYYSNSYHSNRNHNYNPIRRYDDLLTDYSTRYSFYPPFNVNALFNATPATPITTIYTLPTRPIISPARPPDMDIFCSGCGKHQHKNKFSKTQKSRQQNSRRCKKCIEDNTPRGAFTKNDQNEIIKTVTENTANNSNNQEETLPTIANLNQQQIPENTNNNITNNNNINDANSNNNIEILSSENDNNEADFGCIWCEETFTDVRSLTVHCNAVHFGDDAIETQNNNNTDDVIEIDDSDSEINQLQTFENIDACGVQKKKKKKEVKVLPIDGRWIVYYSDVNDTEKDNEYNKLIKHRYKMDLETVKSNDERNGNGKEEADDDGIIVSGHCVNDSGEFEWRFLLKGTLDDNNMFMFSMKGRTDIIYGKARFDGKDTLKRGAWYLNKNMKKECGILRAQRDVEYNPMEEKENDDKEVVLCVICMENECAVACIPCGHVSICRQCTDDVKNAQKCPFCAVAISGVMNVYITGF